MAATGFTHGEQIQRCAIGPTGTLTPSGPITLANGQVVENLEITGSIGVKVPAGVRATLRNCRIIGSATTTNAGYTIRNNSGGGAFLQLENCEVITRYAQTKGLLCTGDVSVSAKRTIFRGGGDNIQAVMSGTPGLVVTNDPDVPMARGLFEECWLGDTQRFSGSHTDCMQIIDNGYILVRRCKILAYSIPIGSDPLTTTTDGSQLAADGIIASYDVNAVAALSNIKVTDSWVEGGNYTLVLAPPATDGPPINNLIVTGNRFGLAHQYGPVNTSPGATRSGNVWGETGNTACCGPVTIGQALTGG